MSSNGFWCICCQKHLICLSFNIWRIHTRTFNSIRRPIVDVKWNTCWWTINSMLFVFSIEWHTMTVFRKKHWHLLGHLFLYNLHIFEKAQKMFYSVGIIFLSQSQKCVKAPTCGNKMFFLAILFSHQKYSSPCLHSPLIALIDCSLSVFIGCTKKGWDVFTPLRNALRTLRNALRTLRCAEQIL